MKQLVILSGKGGSGKTSVAAAFSHLASENHQISVVLADADVDASNLELVMDPRELGREQFWSGKVAEIDQSVCAGCGTCMSVCRFDAIHLREGSYKVDPIACEGCASCFYSCPMGSIAMKDQIAGEWYRSESRSGPLFHAALYPARENSGKLVTLIKQQAKMMALDDGYDLVIVDGPPGIGCPVISATSGADLALIVAEPSKAGVHDMRRIVETTEHFEVPTVVCVNKHDLYQEGTREITTYCQTQDIEIVGLIPFDLEVSLAMANREPVTVSKPDSAASRAIREVWKHVESELMDREP